MASYKFSSLSPGTYRLKIGAAGFKTSEVSGVTVTTTETATVDKVLEVGAVTQTVTVESSVETLADGKLDARDHGYRNANIAALPMANGNYTEILSLSAGTNASVDNATSLGKGTQDISANGVDPGSNNFQMDGVAVNNIANSGSSNDGTIYTGIPVPSPDAIGEFKIQTSTYDASYGRNPGANVNVITKSGTNQFHGSAFEFFRNTVLNANDFFLKQAQAASIRLSMRVRRSTKTSSAARSAARSRRTSSSSSSATGERAPRTLQLLRGRTFGGVLIGTGLPNSQLLRR